MTDIERAPLLEAPEFRSEGTKLVAAGVAMRYGDKSRKIMGRFHEEFRPGAFKKTLQESRVAAHNEHLGPYLASNQNDTLRLTDSPSELAYEIELPDTTAGRDAAKMLERQDIRGVSVGFVPIPSSVTWSVTSDGASLRSISEAKLLRVDLTTQPYYQSTSAEIALRSFADERGLELRSVLNAPSLAELIQQSNNGDTNDENTDDENGREITVFRHPIGHLAY